MRAFFDDITEHIFQLPNRPIFISDNGKFLNWAIFSIRERILNIDCNFFPFNLLKVRNDISQPILFSFTENLCKQIFINFKLLLYLFVKLILLHNLFYFFASFLQKLLTKSFSLILHALIQIYNELDDQLDCLFVDFAGF